MKNRKWSGERPSFSSLTRTVTPVQSGKAMSIRTRRFVPPFSASDYTGLIHRPARIGFIGCTFNQNLVHAAESSFHALLAAAARGVIVVVNGPLIRYSEALAEYRVPPITSAGGGSDPSIPPPRQPSLFSKGNPEAGATSK